MFQLHKSLHVGLQPDQVEAITAQGKEASLLVKQVGRVLSQRIRSCERERRKRKNYIMSSWSQYQADCNGYLRAHDEFLLLMKSISDPEANHE